MIKVSLHAGIFLLHHAASFLCWRLCALLRMLGNGATAMQRQPAAMNGKAPGATELCMLSSNNLPESRGEKILAAARVLVSRARLRDRSSLLAEELATNAAVDVSAIAAPALFIK